jgi:hypothetical protein
MIICDSDMTKNGCSSKAEYFYYIPGTGVIMARCFKHSLLLTAGVHKISRDEYLAIEVMLS